jgi:transposase-like protein
VPAGKSDILANSASYDFPAEHWKRLRTTNVIESSFGTPHRTVRSKGCLSDKTAFATRSPMLPKNGGAPQWPEPVAENHPRY